MKIDVSLLVPSSATATSQPFDESVRYLEDASAPVAGTGFAVFAFDRFLYFDSGDFAPRRRLNVLAVCHA